LIIGTAGHVDHGKTTLVRALTGTDTDRLPEEKRRGMTIDLGYAYAGPLGFIDVPGHERLVATMLAGAGGIDAALLVVAADDGVKPQTVEHARILDLLGIDRGVVAITRADRAPERIEAVAGQVRALLHGGALAGAALFPVAAPVGQGVGEIAAALRALGPRPRDMEGYPRLAVDRAFTVAGAGLVVTGTLVAGRIAAGDRLLLSPPGKEVRVRGLHAHNRPADRAEAGQRVALNLTGIAKDDVTRGDWVLHPDLHAPTSLLDLQLRWLEGRPPRAGLPVYAHLAATHATGRIALLDGDHARLTLDRPIGAVAGDRIVLRDAAATETLGGGTVLDPFPPRRGARAPGRLAMLARQARTHAEALSARLAEAPVEAAEFARARNLPPARLSEVTAKAGAAALAGHLIAPAQLAQLRGALTSALAAHHAARPEEPGLAAARLRAAIAASAVGRTPPTLFAATLAAALRRGEVQQDGPWLRLPGHRIVLTPEEERLWRDAAARIAAERFRPPRTRDLAAALHLPEARMRGALKRFARMGRVVEVAHDQFFLRETLPEMIGIAVAIETRDGVITAAALRDALDNGRKVAILILEFLDAAGVTRREGDERRLRRDRLELFGALPRAVMRDGT
jgi:selenocysteine-specific elongation factor